MTRRPDNCSYNYKHTPTPRPASRQAIEPEIQPRRSTTLVVIQPEVPVRICMYGSEDIVNWPGDVCDKDETAQSCPKFKPIVSSEEVRQKAHALLADDEWVFENMKDVAALQWVVNDRIHRYRPSLFQRLLLWIKVRMLKVPPAKPTAPLPEIPSNFWDESNDPPLDP